MVTPIDSSTTPIHHHNANSDQQLTPTASPISEPNPHPGRRPDGDSIDDTDLTPDNHLSSKETEDDDIIYDVHQKLPKHQNRPSKLHLTSHDPNSESSLVKRASSSEMISSTPIRSSSEPCFSSINQTGLPEQFESYETMSQRTNQSERDNHSSGEITGGEDEESEGEMIDRDSEEENHVEESFEDLIRATEDEIVGEQVPRVAQEQKSSHVIKPNSSQDNQSNYLIDSPPRRFIPAILTPHGDKDDDHNKETERAEVYSNLTSTHETPSKICQYTRRIEDSPLGNSTPLEGSPRPSLSANVMMSPDSDIVEDSRIYEAELCSPVPIRHHSDPHKVFDSRGGLEQDLKSEENHRSHGLTSLLSFSLWDHLKYEVDSANEDQLPELFNSTHLRSERISNFLNVPISIEKMISFGFFICLDAFLSIFTILPIKFFFSFCKLLKSLLNRTFNSSGLLNKLFKNEGGKPRRPNRLGVSNKIDLIQGLLIIMACLVLHHITDASRMYHSVRGQETIKLYVIFNVLEIADRLCCSFGQDILDSLFSPSTLGRRIDGSQPHFKPLYLFILAFIFTVAHTLVLFYQLVSLNVAINSYDHSLMTLLISNQFVEIKGSVFKKFEKENLFQMSCADIVERFQLFLMLTIIAFRNLIELSGSSTSSSSNASHAYSCTYQYLPTSFNIFPSLSLFQTIFLPPLIVILSEVLVDWLKHAFITKFNHIRPSVYGRFIDVLCKDLVGEEEPEDIGLKQQDGKLQPFVDKSPAVSRRLGFSVFPICCLTVRVIFQALDMLSEASNSDEPSHYLGEEAIILESSTDQTNSRISLAYLKKLFGNSKSYSENWIGSEKVSLITETGDHQLGSRSSFSNFQFYLLLSLSLIIGMIFLILFKLYLGICLRYYGLERLKTIETRKEEDLINGKNRIQIGSSEKELMKEKEERKLIESEEFDVPVLNIRFKNRNQQQHHQKIEGDHSDSSKIVKEYKHVEGGNNQRPKISMDELSRFDMVRSRIW